MLLRLGAWVSLLAGAAHAQPLSFRHLSAEAGLSSSVAQAVGVGAEGFVWVGTQAGVDRHDGLRFRGFDAATGGLPDAVVWGVAAEPGTGRLHVGTAAGLARWDPAQGRFAPVAESAVGGATVRALAAAHGALWAGTSGRGLVRLGRAPRRYTAADGALAGDSVRAVAAIPGTAALAIATTRGLTRLDPQTGLARHAPELADGTALAAAGGALWLGRADGRVVRLDPETLAPTGDALDAGAEVSALVPSEAQPGTVWVGTRGAGMARLDARATPATLVPVRVGAAAPRNVVDVAEGGGVLWAATVTGLYAADASPPRFRAIGPSPGGLRVPVVYTVHGSRADLDVAWVGTLDGGLHRLRLGSGRAERWFADPEHPLSIAFDLYEGAGGALWAGGKRASLFRFDPASGALREIVLREGSVSPVTEIVPSRARPGHAWVATQEQGLHLVDLAAERVVPLPVGLADAGRVWTALEPADEPDALYVATKARGLLRVDLATEAVAEVRADGCPLGSETVALAAGPDGALWAGGFAPWLARLDRRTGACTRYSPAEGLPTGGVGALAVDARGHVWVHANHALARFDTRTETFTAFGAADGLPGGALPFHAFDHTPGGEMLVGSIEGLAAFRPDSVAVDTAAAPVRIVEVRVDGEPVALPAGGELALPHDRNDIEIEYAGLDLRRPEATRYRVRLVGADDAWRPAEARVRYPALGPGRYTLRVAATNRDGYWSAPAELALRIRPPYWQTAWFWALVALGAGLAGLAAHRVRVRQLLRVERTRRRIADDLHDDIGSKISSVALRLDAARRAPGLPDAERDRLGRLSATARGVVGDLRDTVWLVDAGHDSLDAVADRIEQAASKLLGAAGGGPRVRVVRDGELPDASLGMEARRDLYLLATEALHNAVRHADAGEVEVRLRAERRAGSGADVFVVEVEDDGRGFDPATERPGRGRATMRRRAEALGGTLEVRSATGAGTAVVLRVPLGRHLAR